MMLEILAELEMKMPLPIEESASESGAFRVGGPDWYLRVSGPWRVINGNAIELASGLSASEPTVAVDDLVGLEVIGIRQQSLHSSMDVALLLSDGRVLETFSEYVYDDWLLKVGNLVVEGPVQVG